MSKSKKVGRASDMEGGSGMGEVRVIVRCTTTVISPHLFSASRLFLQRSNLSGNWGGVVVPRRASEPPFDPPQSGVECRHRACEIGRVVAQPDAQSRKIS